MTSTAATGAATAAPNTFGPGFNLVGLTDAEAAAHPRAFALLSAWQAKGVVQIERPDPGTGEGGTSAGLELHGSFPLDRTAQTWSRSAVLATAPRAFGRDLAAAPGLAPP